MYVIFKAKLTAEHFGLYVATLVKKKTTNLESSKQSRKKYFVHFYLPSSKELLTKLLEREARQLQTDDNLRIFFYDGKTLVRMSAYCSSNSITPV